MCKPTTKTTPRPFELAFSLKACSLVDGSLPPLSSTLGTIFLIVVGLFGVEFVFQRIFEQFSQSHAFLEDETHQRILARHIGVDISSCMVCFLLGWKAWNLIRPVFQAASKPLPAGTNDTRILAFQAEGFRLALFFTAYQVKNLYDTILWNDGPEFVFHHVFSMITAWGAMYPGLCHPYTVYYFGLSELSTAVLCLLSNFDDQHGVPGMGEAFPVLKVIIGAVFVTLFIILRCIIWPYVSLYFIRDVRQTLETGKISPATRRWLRFYMISLGGLSVLQVAWLGQIFIIGKEELQKLGFIN